MEANNKKCLYEAFDKSLGIGYRRAAWEGALKSAFSVIEPWLVPTEIPATRVPCKQVGLSGCDGYRIVAHADGTFAGICDEGNCARRLFAEAELVRYGPNINLFRREVARLFGIAPDLSSPQNHTLQPVGEMRLGKEVVGVKIVGGMDSGLVERMVQLLWQQTRQKQLLLILSEVKPKDRLKGLIERCGWINYTIEEQFDLFPRSLRWATGAEARWEAFKRSLLPLEVVQEEQENVYISAIERGFSEIGRDMKRMKDENAALKEQLASQMSRIAREVDPEFFQWIMTVLGTGSLRSAAEVLGMSKSTLDRRIRNYLKRGGIYEALHGLLTIRTRCFGTRKLESFDDSWARHQVTEASRNEADGLIREIVAALEEADPAHWSEVLAEFSDLLNAPR